MPTVLGQYAQIISLVVAIFFALLATSALMNLYLRRIDHLTIDVDDVRSMARNAGIAVALIALSALFRLLPFFMVLAFLVCLTVFVNVFKINRLLSKMDRL
ncbi:MAG: hypothetical protein JNM22_05770 [Saprospiraceae bacterium]|nr:hypothetical protein [Saprospiraceae bacterium]